MPWNRKGKASWNKGLKGVYICSDETRAKLSLAGKGRETWNKGIPHSEETRKKISETVKKTNNSDEVRQKMIVARKGRTPNLGHHHSKEAKQRISAGCKGRKLSEETIQRMRDARKEAHPVWNKGKKLSEEIKQHMSEAHCGKFIWNRQTAPTKPEQRIIDVIELYKLSFKYTGVDRAIKELRCKPDFICLDKKAVIEVFGRFYHTNSKTLPKIEESDNRKLVHLEKIGWKRLIFWDDELKELTDKEIYYKILSFYESCEKQLINIQ